MKSFRIVFPHIIYFLWAAESFSHASCSGCGELEREQDTPKKNLKCLWWPVSVVHRDCGPWPRPKDQVFQGREISWPSPIPKSALGIVCFCICAFPSSLPTSSALEFYAIFLLLLLKMPTIACGWHNQGLPWLGGFKKTHNPSYILSKGTNIVIQSNRVGERERGEREIVSSRISERWEILGKGGKTGYENNGLIVER